MKKKIWILDNFFNSNWEKSVYESEEKIVNLENMHSITQDAKTQEKIVSSRVNRSFFRTAVLTSYLNTCCITKLHFTELLNASHIIP